MGRLKLMFLQQQQQQQKKKKTREGKEREREDTKHNHRGSDIIADAPLLMGRECCCCVDNTRFPTGLIITRKMASRQLQQEDDDIHKTTHKQRT